MNGNLVSDRQPGVSLLRIFAMVIFGFVILGNVIALIVISFLYPGNLMEGLSDPMSHRDIQPILLLAQGLSAFVALIFLPWFYLKSSEKRTLSPFFKNEKQWWLLVCVVVLATVGLGLAISPAVEWNANMQFPPWTGVVGEFLTEMEKQAEILVKAFTSDFTPLSFSLVFLVVAVLPAFGEELVFRGLIQTELTRAFRNPHVAIWTASVLFSAFHMQFFGFVPRMLIGAFLGYLYYWSGNLWIPMLAHFFNNGLQLIGLYLFQNGVVSFDLESTESPPWPVVVTSIVLVSLLLLYLRNYFQHRLNNLGDSPQQL